ncbi:DUF4235 domain-containing protein [Cellulomonas fimi]|uniref:DUF4235 domain-containing protein n=1 Tax=Cellulomonas fimi TaxID=1708 RepID=A0A7Y0QH99_CELFI|nr:DUF4235 domain-containing protein [Cellulomonas fimi]NMR20070.1 DUF4235 domain-containing protein [Cellulomonas fimi]
MVDTPSQSTQSKLIGAVVALGAAWVAQKIVSTAWQAASGHQPPKADDEGDARFAEVAGAAVITGAVIALVRVLATRGAAKMLR